MSNESFVESVRNSHIRQPNQRGFLLSEWKKEFKNRTSPAEEDIRLYQAGLWFNERLEAVRELLGTVQIPKLDRTTQLRLYVGALNNAFRVLTETGIERMSHVDQDTGHSVITPQGEAIAALENLISAARYPLSSTLQSQGPPASTVAADDDTVLQHVVYMLELAVAYDTLEHFWAECVWNGWYVDETLDVDIVKPSDPLQVLVRAVGEYRRESLLMELVLTGTRLWNELPISDRRAIAAWPQIAISDHDTKFVLEWRTDMAKPPDSYFHRLWAEEIYYQELLADPLPVLHNLSIRHILLIWNALAPLAGIYYRNLPIPTGRLSYEQVIACSNVIERNEFLAVIEEGFNITREQANAVIDLLSLTGTPQQDPWLRPLVKISEEQLIPIIASLASPNLLRSVEYWMKIGGLDLGERGPAFEQYIRRMLADANLLENSTICVEPFTLRVGNEAEEIDLVIRIGNKLLLGELKCSVYPSSPHEYYRFVETLKDGTQQILRKVRFVEAHLGDFLRALAWEEQIEINATTLIPVVVSNVPLALGYKFYNVPIVDTLVLSRYFQDPIINRFVMVLPDGTRQVGDKTILYSNTEEAEAHIEQYLQTPPTFELLAERVTSQVLPLMVTKPGTKAAAVIYNTVIIPELNSELHMEYMPEDTD